MNVVCVYVRICQMSRVEVGWAVAVNGSLKVSLLGTVQYSLALVFYVLYYPSRYKSQSPHTTSLFQFQWVWGKFWCHLELDVHLNRVKLSSAELTGGRHWESSQVVSSANVIVSSTAILCRNLSVCVLHWCGWARHGVVRDTAVSSPVICCLVWMRPSASVIN